MRYPIIICAMALIATGVYFGLQLQPPSILEDWFPPQHIYAQHILLFNSDVFHRSAQDDVADVSIVYGVKYVGGLDVPVMGMIICCLYNSTTFTAHNSNNHNHNTNNNTLTQTAAAHDSCACDVCWCCLPEQGHEHPWGQPLGGGRAGHSGV